MKKFFSPFIFLVFISYNYALAVNDEPIIVTADKFKRAYEKSTSTILKLTATEISKSGASNVADLLKTQAGINLFTNGSFGKASSLFLRGTSNRHTLVFVDGMRVTDLTAIGGGSRLEFLSTSNVESIEVLKGSQGVIYGGEAIGGVIKITTKTGDTSPVLRLSAGSFGQFSVAGRTPLVRGKDKKNRLGEIQFSHKRADGISSFNDARVSKAEADGYETNSLRYKNSVEKNGRRFTLKSFFQDSKSQFDSSSQDVNGNETTYQTYGAYGAYEPYTSGSFHPKLSLEYRRIKSDSLIVSGGSPTAYLYDGNMVRGELGLPVVLEKGLEISSGLNFEREAADALDNKLSSTEGRSRYAAYFQARKEWGGLFTEIGGRFESVEDVDKRGLYRAALGFNFGKWTFKAHRATGFKAPSLYQNFSGFGNRDLGVEKSLSHEISVLYLNTVQKLKYELSIFSIDYSNFIDFDSGTNRYENLGAQDNTGVESSLAFTIEKIKFLIESNLLRAKNPVTGDYALRRPRQRHSFAVERSLHRDWMGRLSGVYVGERQERNQVRMPSYLTFDLHLGYSFRKEQINFDFRNILDREYEEIRNFGTPGQNFLVSWERKF